MCAIHIPSEYKFNGVDLLLSIPFVIVDFSQYFSLDACQPWTDSDFIDHVIKTQ